MIFCIVYKNLDTFFLRFVTIPSFDRQMDGQTDGQTDGRTDTFLATRPLYIQCSAVKMISTNRKLSYTVIKPL